MLNENESDWMKDQMRKQITEIKTTSNNQEKNLTFNRRPTNYLLPGSIMNIFSYRSFVVDTI